MILWHASGRDLCEERRVSLTFWRPVIDALGDTNKALRYRTREKLGIPSLTLYSTGPPQRANMSSSDSDENNAAASSSLDTGAGRRKSGRVRKEVERLGGESHRTVLLPQLESVPCLHARWGSPVASQPLKQRKTPQPGVPKSAHLCRSEANLHANP